MSNEGRSLVAPPPPSDQLRLYGRYGTFCWHDPGV